jgi:hypothetical protein
MDLSINHHLKLSCRVIYDRIIYNNLFDNIFGNLVV